jgi:hypothetical protein
MQIVEIDGSSWKTTRDAVEGLLSALKPIGGHGSSIDAFIDSMIYGGMLETEPPYEVVVRGISSPQAITFVSDLASALVEARKWRRANYGDDVQVVVSIT